MLYLYENKDMAFQNKYNCEFRKGYSAILCKIYVHEFIVISIEITAILKYFQRSNRSRNFILKAIPHKTRGNE